MKRKTKQLELHFRTWGGKRRGAGRKPTSKRPGISHSIRPALAARFPVHVTMKVRREVGRIRTKRCIETLRRCFVAGCSRDGFRLVHWSVQDNHLHLIVEATNAERLARGIQGIGVRIARGLNRVLNRRGRLFADRYHARILRTPREIRAAIVYVLQNGRRHLLQRGIRLLDRVDTYSSAAWFDGWRGVDRRVLRAARAGPDPVASARTWLLARGWRRWGLVGGQELPAGSRS